LTKVKNSQKHMGTSTFCEKIRRDYHNNEKELANEDREKRGEGGWQRPKKQKGGNRKKSQKAVKPTCREWRKR